MIIENTPRLETERLILRRFDEGDIGDMFEIYSHPEVNRFLPWFPHKTPEDTRAFLLGELLPEYAKPAAYRYAVELKSESKVVGYLSLNPPANGGDLGYGLNREYWGRGIIPEAAGVVLERLRRNGLSHITATHDINNPASGRVMQKLGMTYSHSYDEQWQPKDFKVTFALYRLDF